MPIVPSTRQKADSEKPSMHAEAPAAHVDALLRILEDTDAALSPMMQRGMDGRTAQILKEIEKSGAIAVHTEGDDVWIDVIDRKKALGVVDQLINSLRK